VPIADVVETPDTRGGDIDRKILAEQIQSMGRLQDRRIVGLIAEGLTYREVAAELHTSKAYARKIWQRTVERLRNGILE